MFEPSNSFVQFLDNTGHALATWLLLIVWVVWWLGGVNWRNVWPVLADGAWAPGVLLLALGALVWSQIAPTNGVLLGFFPVPNFWYQLGWVGSLAALTLFCGWLQGVFQWAPAEIDLEPVAHAHGHDHGHAHEPVELPEGATPEPDHH